MKIKIISNPITPYGSFDKGQILTDQKYAPAFLAHLVDANAAEYIDKEAYLTKVVEVEEVKKTIQSSPSSQPAKASNKKTSTLRKKKRKS